MALFEKLVGTEEPKLPIHTFAGSLHLWAKGVISRADIVASYGLNGDDEADLDFLKGRYDAIPTVTPTGGRGASKAADKTDFIATIEMLLIHGEDGGRFGLDDRAAFVAAVNQL